MIDIVQRYGFMVTFMSDLVRDIKSNQGDKNNLQHAFFILSTHIGHLCRLYMYDL